MKKFPFLGRCPVCRRKYVPEQARLVGKENQTMLVHVDCKHCASSAILAVSAAGMGMITTIGVLTDLTKEDAFHFKNANPVSVDDVLEIHNYFK